MDRPTANPSDENTPGRKPEVSSNPTAGHVANVPQFPVQTTLFDVSQFIPDGDMNEAAEMLERAIAMRDYVQKVSEYTYLEDAVEWAGLPPRPRGRAFVVNSGAPLLALKLGWVIRTGGKRAAEKFSQSHGGLVRQYRRPNNGGTP